VVIEVKVIGVVIEVVIGVEIEVVIGVEHHQHQCSGHVAFSDGLLVGNARGECECV
jgi:hypothetical protein